MNNYPVIISGLLRLEGIGYDSVGLAIYDDKKINLSITKGKGLA